MAHTLRAHCARFNCIWQPQPGRLAAVPPWCTLSFGSYSCPSRASSCTARSHRGRTCSSTNPASSQTYASIHEIAFLGPIWAQDASLVSRCIRCTITSPADAAAILSLLMIDLSSQDTVAASQSALEFAVSLTSTRRFSLRVSYMSARVSASLVSHCALYFEEGKPEHPFPFFGRLALADLLPFSNV